MYDFGVSELVFWVSGLTFWVSDLYFMCLDLYFRFLDLYFVFWTCIFGFELIFGCLDLYFGCLNLYFGYSGRVGRPGRTAGSGEFNIWGKNNFGNLYLKKIGRKSGHFSKRALIYGS